MKANKHSWPNFPWRNLYDNAVKKKLANDNFQTDIEPIHQEVAPLVEIEQGADYNNESKSLPQEQILPLPAGRGVRIFS